MNKRRKGDRKGWASLCLKDNFRSLEAIPLKFPKTTWFLNQNLPDRTPWPCQSQPHQTLLCVLSQPAGWTSLQARWKPEKALKNKNPESGAGFQDATSHLLLIYISLFCWNCLVLHSNCLEMAQKILGLIDQCSDTQQPLAVLEGAPPWSRMPMGSVFLDCKVQLHSTSWTLCHCAVPQEKAGLKVRLSFSFFTSLFTQLSLE